MVQDRHHLRDLFVLRRAYPGVRLPRHHMGFIAGSTLILGDHSRGLPRLARTAIAFAIGFGLLVWAGFTLLLNVPVPEGMFL